MKRLENTRLISGIQHIGIPTNDIEVTTTFYESLGFHLQVQTFNEKTAEKVVFLQLGNLVIETYENKSETMNDGTIDHIALNVQDIDSLYAEIEELNFTLLTDGIQFLPFWEYGIRYFIIQGPNKEKLEFCERLQKIHQYRYGS